MVTIFVRRQRRPKTVRAESKLLYLSQKEKEEKK